MNSRGTGRETTKRCIDVDSDLPRVSWKSSVSELKCNPATYKRTAFRRNRSNRYRNKIDRIRLCSPWMSYRFREFEFPFDHPVRRVSNSTTRSRSSDAERFRRFDDQRSYRRSFERFVNTAGNLVKREALSVHLQILTTINLDETLE